MHKLLSVTAATLVLAGAASAQTASNDEMRNLTSSILAGISGKAPEPAATSSRVGTDALRGLVEQALKEGQSDAYLEALISEAADKGQIAVSDSMRTTTGEVDTRTLLASLVSKSEAAPADVEALIVEASGEPLADRFYQVVSGDSLAAISLSYYGNASDYTRIFEANRDSLSRPDLIGVGQILLIPR